MKDYVLLAKIKELYSEVGVACDDLDIAITLSKMLDNQRQDLAAMIAFLSEQPDASASHILAQAMHDLNGLKATYLGLPEGDCFSPRSSGYAKRQAS